MCPYSHVSPNSSQLRSSILKTVHWLLQILFRYLRKYFLSTAAYMQATVSHMKWFYAPCAHLICTNKLPYTCLSAKVQLTTFRSSLDSSFAIGTAMTGSNFVLSQFSEVKYMCPPRQCHASHKLVIVMWQGCTFYSNSQHVHLRTPQTASLFLCPQPSHPSFLSLTIPASPNVFKYLTNLEISCPTCLYWDLVSPFHVTGIRLSSAVAVLTHYLPKL